MLQGFHSHEYDYKSDLCKVPNTRSSIPAATPLLSDLLLFGALLHLPVRFPGELCALLPSEAILLSPDLCAGFTESEGVEVVLLVQIRQRVVDESMRCFVRPHGSNDVEKGGRLW